MKYILLFLISFIFVQISFGYSMLDNKKRVADSAEDICPIKVGTKILSVNVRNLEGENVDLNLLTTAKKQF